MKHKLKITQVCQVERVITVEVEADSVEQAIELQQEDEAPAYDNPNWIEYPDLMSEVVTHDQPT